MKILLKTSFREIKNSPMRFLSIFGIIFLGVAFFVGLSAAGPDMQQGANNHFREKNLADVSIISSLGLTDNDLAVLSDDPSISSIQKEYFVDIDARDEQVVFRIFSYQEKQELNQYQVTKGRLPEKKGEIALDDQAQGTYKLGDVIDFSTTNTETIDSGTYEVVGFVTSPEYIESASRGNTNVGNGTIDYFAVIPEESFTSKTYTRFLIRYFDLAPLDSFSEEYTNKVTDHIKTLKEQFSNRSQERLVEVQNEGQKELDKAQKKIDDGRQQLQEAKEQLTEAKKAIDQAKDELAEKEADFQAEITQAESEITRNQQTLDDNQQTVTQQKQELAGKEEQLKDSETQLKQGEATLAEAVNQKTQLVEAINQLQTGIQATTSLSEQMNQVKALPVDQQAHALLDYQNEWLQTLQKIGADQTVLAQLQSVNQETAADFLILLPSLTESLSEQGQELQTQLSTAQGQLNEIENQENQIAVAKQQLAAGKEQLESGKTQLTTAQEELDAGYKELAAGKDQLAAEKASRLQQFTEAKEKLSAEEENYQQKLKEFQEQEPKETQKLDQAQAEVDQQQKELDGLEPASFIFNTRKDNPGYSEFNDNANRVSSLATVFPVIFFLIAALVTLTTMTRMIEEKRIEIGTFKALGYRNREIALKFLIYALFAGMLGTVGGLALGFRFFPSIIVNAYGVLYNIPSYPTPWYLSYGLIALGVSLLCTVGVSMIVLRIDLLSTPAILLRPKAPKAGKRILLERMTPIWKRMSFIQKVTMRNLFRYKSRMLMTLLGIAGCTSMIVTGFGLRDSISNIIPLQFEKIWHYQSIVTLDDGGNDNYQAALEKVDHVKENLAISMESFTSESQKVKSQAIQLYVPKDADRVTDFISFSDRKTGESYSLTDKGAVINEKLAKLFDLSVGDELTIENAENQEFTLKIAAIVENYVGNFAYVTSDYYQEVFDAKPDFNADLLMFNKNLTKSEEKDLAQELMDNDGVLNVSFLSDSANTLDDTTDTLNLVVWILIVSAGALAFIVLYNLNNINISERIRELSTIKVLGFYNKEVTMYIYRENIFLTIFGTFIGLCLGILEHKYVLNTIEVDMAMFSPTIEWMSYVYSALLTCFFSIVVGIVMFFTLKRVDMIEALKSNE